MTSNKVWLITGAGRGLGVDIARAALAAGHAVVATGRNPGRVTKALGEHDNLLVVTLDVTEPASAGAAVQAAVDQFGRLDVLVNNAGMRLYQTVVDASEESWDAILAVNVKGYAFCAKAAIPLMRQTGGGSIVNVASIRSVVAGGNMVQYDTTKAAVAGLTRAMAFDHAGEGIRVNAVCPGPIFTRFHERRATTAGKTFEQFRAEFGHGTMLRRPGTPAEVAACIVFLAGDDASYVTGTSLYVDGGQVSL
jgi:NAD(P)-dependent dehydrogenase (short-subunit alcohol dehydrogenase family)